MLALTVAYMHDNKSEGDILADAPKIHLGRNCGRAQKTGGNGGSVRLTSNTTQCLSSDPLCTRTGIQFYRIIAEPNRSAFEVLLS